MRLYGTVTSPYVRKARIVLKEKNVACEFVATHPSDAGSPVASVNPLAKIPVLVRDDGEAVYDSLVIAEYVDAIGSGERLFPQQGDARWTVLRWQAFGQGMIDATVARMMETRRPPEKQMANTIAHQEGKIAAALKYADGMVKGKNRLIGGQFTMADIALGAALEYLDLRFNSEWRKQYPRLVEWLASVAERPSFVESQPPRA